MAEVYLLEEDEDGRYEIGVYSMNMDFIEYRPDKYDTKAACSAEIRRLADERDRNMPAPPAWLLEAR